MTFAPLPWQTACEQALHDFTRQDALRFWGWGHELDGLRVPAFDYRFEHTLAVVKLAEWLAPLVDADADVLTCAAWLHDCRKMLGWRGPDNHAEDAGNALDGILEGTDFPRHKISAVRHAISNHVGLSLKEPLEPLETACLWDIDKLSKLGAASLIHFIGIAPAFQPTSTSEVLEKGEKWLKLAHGIVDSMNTAPAKSEAAKRFEFLRHFYEQLIDEWETI
ncbi:MAG: HD domain-containing protein [Holophagales bacterium]|nr:HD domain-containing protein [Holophagales bacterium]